MSDPDANGPLPDGWVATTLGAVGTYLNGRAFKSSEWSKTGRPIIRIQDLTGSNRNPNYFKGEVADRHVVRKNDLLISWSATLGAYIWEGPEGVLNQHIFKVVSKIDRRFHYHLVRNAVADLESRAHGSGMVHVTKGVFDDTKIGVPPAREQERIVERLDEIEAHRAVTAGHLQTAGAVLARFRGAVLAAACSGRLTEDWRETDRDARADDVLARADTTMTDNRELHLDDHDADFLEDVPPRWRVVCLGELAESIRGGSSEVPVDSITEFPVLRSSSVRPLCIMYDDVRYLSTKQSRKAENFIEDGDILVTRLNGNIEYVGNAAVVEGLGDRRLQYPDRLFRVRLREPVHAQYLQLFLASPAARAQVRAASRSAAGHQRISISDLKSFSIKLPPLDEQQEIVTRANALLATGAHLTAQVERTAATLDRVDKASLAKAFRGELVPTEAALAEERELDSESEDVPLASPAHRGHVS